MGGAPKKMKQKVSSSGDWRQNDSEAGVLLAFSCQQQ